jgi:hypothetical protein
MTCSTFDFGYAVDNAVAAFYYSRPRPYIGVHLWLEKTYGISAILKGGDASPFPYKSSGEWGVYRIEDEEKATLFKIEWS